MPPVHSTWSPTTRATLEPKPEQIEAHRKLVQQADLLFGSRHYAHYDFLLRVGDQLGGIGLEHHQSSENGVAADYFTDWKTSFPTRDLLPHEFAHSWNGKFRRPADLWTPNYNVPMHDSLLWVYEGQTQYWGHVLAARAGLSLSRRATTWPRRANYAGGARAAPGATCRTRPTSDDLEPTRGSTDWSDWQRGADYYDERLSSGSTSTR